MLAREYISGLASEDATLVVVPGTDDTGARNLGRWLSWFFALFARVVIIDYPGTVGPIVGGWKADRYDASRDKAVDATVRTVSMTAGKVVVIGYSQGAEAAWLAAARLHRLGLKPDTDIELVVWAHPQHPTGFKASLEQNHPVASWVLRRFFGAETNGAADESATGYIRVTSIAITGDPVTALEVWYKNPLGFVCNSLAGFFMIHAGLGQYGAARVGALSIWGAWKAPDSCTTHVAINSAHPVTQLLRWRRYVPGVLVQRIIATLAPVSLPGQRSASIFAVRRNWRTAGRLILAEVTPLPAQPKEKQQAAEAILAPAS